MGRLAAKSFQCAEALCALGSAAAENARLANNWRPAMRVVLERVDVNMVEVIIILVYDVLTLESIQQRSSGEKVETCCGR